MLEVTCRESSAHLLRQHTEEAHWAIRPCCCVFVPCLPKGKAERAIATLTQLLRPGLWIAYRPWICGASGDCSSHLLRPLHQVPLCGRCS